MKVCISFFILSGIFFGVAMLEDTGIGIPKIENRFINIFGVVFVMSVLGLVFGSLVKMWGVI